MKSLCEDLHKWKKVAEEKRFLAAEALDQVKLLEDCRSGLLSQLNEQERQITSLEAACMNLQGRIFRDHTRIRKLERDSKQASRNAVEEFKRSSALPLYKAAISRYKTSSAFQDDLAKAVKRLQDSSVSRARDEGDLRGMMSRIVEDVYLQCPHIDFLKVREIGAFGEYHLTVTGKRKQDVPESSAREGSSSKKHH